MTMYSLQTSMPTASALFSAYASLSALLMLLRSVANELVPRPARDYLYSLLASLFRARADRLTLVVEEFHANGISRNVVYDSAEAYLTTRLTSPTTDRLKISQGPKDPSLTVRFERGEKIPDSYEGVPLLWRFCSVDSKKPRSPSDPSDDPSSSSAASFFESRFFELTVDKHHKDKIVNSYIPYVVSRARALKAGERQLKLHTLSSNRFSCGGVYWDSVNLEHPSTFDTLAVDPGVKSSIMDDLDRFTKRRDFYRRVGRAWKRGYLLYGPPGTGKSSLIAAMANHLRFDIYDLQLGSLMRDSDLRKLLLATANRSILVIEDIDCTVEIKDCHRAGNNKKTPGGVALDVNGLPFKPPDVQMTLSGLLNFVDGLWSSCGDERIIVFTTNHKERLDPALLRPGRMDVHIHMSYLSVPSFRILVSNYLQLKGEHRLFGEIEKLIESVNVTPAQVAEELMRTEHADEALEGVLRLLKRKNEVVENGEVVEIECSVIATSP